MENIYDIAIDELHKMRKMVRGELSKEYKKTKPFRMEPVSKEQQIYDYEQLTPEDMGNMLNTYGEDSTNEFIFRLEKMKREMNR